MVAQQIRNKNQAWRDGVSVDGSVHVNQRLPFSSLASPAAKHAFATRISSGPATSDPATLRAHYGRFNDALAEEAKQKYHVEVVDEIMGNVRVQRVIPASVSRQRRDAVLVNLHGGAFMWGAGSGALVEAIPVAAATGLNVIAVDYRMAPEHRFPAASEDVAAAYEHLLKHYAPGRIGLYGLSAGATLAAQTIAWLLRHSIPLPGAVAMLGAAGADFGGDTTSLGASMMGEASGATIRSIFETPYLQGADPDDPLAMPACDDRVLARFPPSLLITASRDFAASSVTRFHRQLVANGVDARLFMFDGLWHAFHIFSELPESDEAHSIMAAFFRRELKLARDFA
jgi:monoterpene epsilon-lactone hydrolase